MPPYFHSAGGRQKDNFIVPEESVEYGNLLSKTEKNQLCFFGGSI